MQCITQWSGQNEIKLLGTGHLRLTDMGKAMNRVMESLANNQKRERTEYHSSYGIHGWSNLQ